MASGTWRSIGRNTEARVEGDYLMTRTNLRGEQEPSASGKSRVIGSTQGNRAVDTGVGTVGEVKVGLNVYKSA